MSFTISLSKNWGADGWTLVPRDILRDQRLSWKARGLVAFLASHEPGFELNHEFLIRAATDGETSLESGLRELRELGYLEVHRVRNEQGQLGDSEYILHREPCSGESPVQVGAYSGVSQAQGNPGPGKSGTKRDNSLRETTQKDFGADAPTSDPPHSGMDGEQGELIPVAEPVVRQTKTRAKPKTFLPADWRPNEAHVAKAKEWGWERDQFIHETRQFRNHWQAKGQPMADWDACFRTWMNNAQRWAQQRNGQRSTTTKPHAWRTRNGMIIEGTATT